MSSEDFKQQGNAAFQAKKFEEAVAAFSKAIELAETPNHVLYSNRSAAYVSMGKFFEGLKDAEECTNINPVWAKGFNRVGAAQLGLGDYDEAKKAYQKALDLDPANAMAKEGLRDIEGRQQSSAEPAGMQEMFAKLTDPLLIDKLKGNPQTRELMNDPALVQKVKNMQVNPQSIAQDMMSDPRLMTIITTILGIDLNQDPNGGQEPEPVPAAPKAAEPKPKAAPAPVEEVVVENDAKTEADAFKAQANALYKSRNFDEAIELYNKAFETFPDITYLNNRAAAEFEKKDFDTAIETCKLAVEKGRDMRADYKLIAKSFARIGNCLVKKGELKDAVEYFQKSLTEHRTADTLNKLRATEKELKDLETASYIDSDKAEEARLRGKDYFTAGDWPNAVKEYTEMIKRDPKDARGYSNRAAALAKLMSFLDAVRDCNEAIKLDPKFIRAYIRKANAQIAMKEYKACADTLHAAQEVEKANGNNAQQLAEIEGLLQKALSQRFAPLEGETYDQTMARIQKDPEVVEIINDPVMNTILQQAQNNPAALQEHMKNPDVYQKVMILMAAGIIRTR